VALDLREHEVKRRGPVLVSNRESLGASKPVEEFGTGSFGDVIGESAGRPKPAAYPV